MNINEKRLSKDYTLEYNPISSGMSYGEITIPKGTKTNSLVASKGNKLEVDTHCNYVSEFGWIPKINIGDREIRNYSLEWAATHYGINVPEEYLEEIN